jgi:CysZ protein
MSHFLADCTRGMRIAFKNFFIELFITIGILIFSLLIGWLLPIAPLAILVIESYFFGYAMIDYRNEYYDIPRSESHEMITDHPGLAIGNGLFFNLSLLVPLLGILFAPVIALIAAGLTVNYVEKRKEILCPSNQSILSMAKS